MLTILGKEDQKVRGLDSGADDYLAKPFGADELMARVRAVLRRARAPSEPQDSYGDPAIRVDFQRHQVYVRGEETELTPLEFRLLAALVLNAGQVLSVERILDTCWGERPGGPMNVRLYVNYLRRKIETDPASPKLIETVREFGYRYRPPEADGAGGG